MLLRLYAHNYRCLSNFELLLDQKTSVLLIGKNGSGKSTVRAALEVLQQIARGANRVDALVKPREVYLSRRDEPVRLEVDVLLNEQTYQYRLVLEHSPSFRELRVQSETLLCDGRSVFSRELAHVALKGSEGGSALGTGFNIDWHVVALPLI